MTLKQFSKNVKNLSKKEMDKICEEILREMTLRFLKKVIQVTPVGKSQYVQRRLRKENGEYLRYVRGKSKGRIKTKRVNTYTGGTLRRGWILGKQSLVSRILRRKVIVTNKSKPNDQEIKAFINTLKFKKAGKYYRITVVNPIEYAKFVNYGHRKRGGKGWVQGYHFVEKAEQYINRNQNKIFKKIFEEELKRRLGL